MPHSKKLVNGYQLDEEDYCLPCALVVAPEKNIQLTEKSALYPHTESERLQYCERCSDVIPCKIVYKDGFIQCMAHYVADYLLHPKQEVCCDFSYQNTLGSKREYTLRVFYKDYHLEYEIRERVKDQCIQKGHLVIENVLVEAIEEIFRNFSNLSMTINWDAIQRMNHDLHKNFASFQQKVEFLKLRDQDDFGYYTKVKSGFHIEL